MRLGFIHVQFRHHAGLSELAMHSNGIAQQEIARPRGENRGREAAHVSVDRR